MSKVQRRAWRLPVFYPHPHGCSPPSILSTCHISGENPCERGLKQISVKSGERFILEKNRNKRKFRSFPHQISGLVSVKVRVVWYKLMIMFLLHFQTHFASEICAIARSLMFMRKFGIFYFYDHKLVIPLQMWTHHIINYFQKLVCGLYSRFWSIQQCWFDVSINTHPRVRYVRNFWKLSVQIPPISDPESSSNALS